MPVRPIEVIYFIKKAKKFDTFLLPKRKLASLAWLAKLENEIVKIGMKRES